MAILLHIDTAGEKAFVAITQNLEILGWAENTVSNTHAQFVQDAIAAICTAQQFSLNKVDAIVVTMGPGSYTGLRVGLSSAKGIAYALDKPLIGLSTLSLLAHAAIKQINKDTAPKNFQVFAMIDARRMEVFGAIYNQAASLVLPEQAIILDEALLETYHKNQPLFCIGSGVLKTKEITKSPNIYFIEQCYQIQDCIELALVKLSHQDFEDIAYSSPSYIKDFYMK